MVSYKASGGYSHARKHRGVYWATSLAMTVFTISLFSQGYVLETWGVMFVLSFIFLGFTLQVFSNTSKLIHRMQENQLPKMIVDKEAKDNAVGLALFIRLSDVYAAMKLERKVVVLALLVFWFDLAASFVAAGAGHGLPSLFMSVFLAPALVSAVYGVMSMNQLKLRVTCL